MKNFPKKSWAIAVFLLAASLAGGMLVHAQTTETTAMIPASPANLPSLESYSDAQLEEMMSELAALPLLWPTNLPDHGLGGTYWSLAHPDWPPLPAAFGTPAWRLTKPSASASSAASDASADSAASTGSDFYLLDDLDYPPSPGDSTTNSGDDYTSEFSRAAPINTNLLWLQITNISSSTVFANLNNATDQIYAIWSTTNLALPFADWQVETEVMPTNATMPFTVLTQNRPDLFLRAEDWSAEIQPANQTVLEGSNVTFSVTGGGAGSLSYQWYWDGTALSDNGGVFGSASATLTLGGVMSDQAGYYYLVASNNFGSVTSLIATLTVLQPTNAYDTLYIIPPDAYWNVTDISDPAMPVAIGELQAPFSEPMYDGNIESTPLPPFNTVWQSNTIVAITAAYGTTTFGGSSNYGTVFKIDPSGPPDGAYPSEMVLAGNVLYGTTAGLEDGNSAGTIFSINTDGSGFTNLYSFGIATDDGTNPCCGLVLCGNTLYGTTEYGGTNGLGTIFSINTNGSNYHILYSFGPAVGDGAYPCAKLILCGDTLFGTTSEGGAGYSGTVFQINTNGSYQTLHYFSDSDGADPEAELLLSNGVLYGTTLGGGENGAGTVFGINTNNVGNEITVFHSFGDGDDDGQRPKSGLVMAGNILYGTTEYGGTKGSGTVFAVTTNSSYSVLHSFNNNSTNDGYVPYASLTLSGNTLYGTTYYGGASGNGTVFSLNTNGSSFTNLYSFQDSGDGRYPETALVFSNHCCPIG